jgi:hypothetical protein
VSTTITDRHKSPSFFGLMESILEIDRLLSLVVVIVMLSVLQHVRADRQRRNDTFCNATNRQLPILPSFSWWIIHSPANAAGDFSLCLHSHAAEFHGPSFQLVSAFSNSRARTIGQRDSLALGQGGFPRRLCLTDVYFVLSSCTSKLFQGSGPSGS